MVADLLKKTNGYPIELRTNISYQELNDLYGKSSIYWHAAGYDIDENKNPELVEHFGITTVEAMSSGTIPIVINKGGQKEIVSEGEDGYLFETIEELVEKTQSLIALKQDKWNTIKEKAILHAKEFSVDKFCERVESFL